MLNGVDLSYANGAPDFDELKTAVDFAMIQANFGVPPGGKTDVQFARSWAEATRVGLQRGAYHYAYPANSADSSAQSFVDAIGNLLPGDVLALDFEEPYSDPVGWCLNWLNSVYEATTVRPLLYINLSMANSHDWTTVIDGGYGLWVADWNYDPTTDNTTNPWPVTAMRQWTNKGNVAGLTGVVDQDVFYGDAEAFAKYGYQAPVVPAPTPTPDPVPEPTPDPTVPPTTPPDPTPLPTPTLPPGTPPLTPVPNDPWWEKDEEAVVNWLGTTLGGLILKLAGAALGYLSVHAGLLHLSDIGTSLVGLVLGSTLHEANKN